MKFLKFTIFLFMIPLIQNANAQDTYLFSEPEVLRKNSFKINITQLIMREFRFGYERALSNKHSIGMGIAISQSFPTKTSILNFLERIEALI